VNNPDVMVSEAAMELRIFVLWHMTRHTVFGTNRTVWWVTRLRIVSCASRCISDSGRMGMASVALCVVKVRITHEKFMGIVTGQARDP
jgi:hypothetical protein